MLELQPGCNVHHFATFTEHLTPQNECGKRPRDLKCGFQNCNWKTFVTMVWYSILLPFGARPVSLQTSLKQGCYASVEAVRKRMVSKESSDQHKSVICMSRNALQYVWVWVRGRLMLSTTHTTTITTMAVTQAARLAKRRSLKMQFLCIGQENVLPKPVLSGLSGGNQKTTSVSAARKMQGKVRM